MRVEVATIPDHTPQRGDAETESSSRPHAITAMMSGMSDTPPPQKRRRSFGFWASVTILIPGILYPLSFGPACWLDSQRQRESNAVTVSKRLNTFYYPIISVVQRLDNGVGDMILWYAELFAADGRRAHVAPLARPGSTTGSTWLVWIRRDWRPAPGNLPKPRSDDE